MTPEMQLSEYANGGKEGNEKGIAVEERVAGILLEQDIVCSVTNFDKWSQQDLRMVDLSVVIKPDMGFAIESVDVQVKSSSKGYQHLREEIKKRIKVGEIEDEETEDVRTFLLRNRLIVIVGQNKKSRSGRTSWLVSDEEIAKDFNRQLLEIDNYWKAQ